MKLCASLRQWPPESETPLPASVKGVALPWAAVAEHVSHGDLPAKPLRESLASRGARLNCVELSPLTCLDDASFERQTDDAYMQMQVAGRLGVRTVIISSGHEGTTGWDATVAALARLAALAESMGLRICVRNVCGSALEQIDTLHVLFKHVASTALGLCLDNVEFQRAAVNPADAALSFSDGIALVRLGDEFCAKTCALGQGNAHVCATLETLATEHFKGPLLVDFAQLPVALDRFGLYLD